MASGARIVNMVSCTYAISRLDFPDFFHRGKQELLEKYLFIVTQNWLCYYLLFELSSNFGRKESPSMLPIRGVSTDIITMHKWFDPLTDIFFRPFIRKAEERGFYGNWSVAGQKEAGVTERTYVNNHRKSLSG